MRAGTIVKVGTQTVACRQITFLWHEPDGQGGTVANDTVDLRLGTLSRYVGVEPDPSLPGQVRPVWGAAETLVVVTRGLGDGDAGLPTQADVPIAPLPGQPDHLAGSSGGAVPEDDVFEYWSDFGIGPPLWRGALGETVTIDGAYRLLDAYDNVTYGFVQTTATQPASNVAVDFHDQTGTGVDFAGYALGVTWNVAPPVPEGDLASTLTVSYPEDPDWPAGTVSTTVTLRFQRGTFRALVWKRNYELPYGDDDGSFPIDVSPGAGGEALPATASGNGVRLVLLPVAGAQVWDDVFEGGTEPIPGGVKTWVLDNGQWTSATFPGQDPQLQTADGEASFRLALVDTFGTVASEAAFQVHTCPRADHGWSCADLPVESVAGEVSAITATGYLGVELTRAPLNPGTYYVLVTSLSGTYRIRQGGAKYTSPLPEGDVQGAFSLCTVMGGEFLDENLRRVDVFAVNKPTTAYVRYVDPSTSGAAASLTLATYDEMGSEFATEENVETNRIGSSSIFLSGPIRLIPVWDVPPQGLQSPVARGMSAPATAEIPVPKRTVPGWVKATASNRSVAKVLGQSGVLYQVPIGLRLPLSVFKETHKNSSDIPITYCWLCSPLAGFDDCGPDIVDPDRVTAWSVSPAVDADGPNQRLRFEKEGTAIKQWYLRGIRWTSNRTPKGVVSISATLTAFSTAPVSLEVKRPTRLACCATQSCPGMQAGTSCFVTYNGQSVNLEQLIISEADTSGMPPQYLAAQILRESSLNPYSFRYEPSSRDFKVLTGDWHHSALDSVLMPNEERKLLTAGRLDWRLGLLRSDGMVEYLPCRNEDWSPCVHVQYPDPPQLESPVELVGDMGGTVFGLPNIGSDHLYLDALVLNNPQYTPNYKIDCAGGGALAPLEYCVDGDHGVFRFGSLPTPPSSPKCGGSRKRRTTPHCGTSRLPASARPSQARRGSSRRSVRTTPARAMCPATPPPVRRFRRRR